MTEKTCTTCGTTYPATEAYFHLKGHHNGALRSDCRWCRNSHQNRADRRKAHRAEEAIKRVYERHVAPQEPTPMRIRGYEARKWAREHLNGHDTTEHTPWWEMGGKLRKAG